MSRFIEWVSVFVMAAIMLASFIYILIGSDV